MSRPNHGWANTPTREAVSTADDAHVFMPGAAYDCILPAAVAKRRLDRPLAATLDYPATNCCCCYVCQFVIKIQAML